MTVMAKHDTESTTRHVQEEPAVTRDGSSLTDISERLVPSPMPSTKENASPPFRKRNFVEWIWHFLGVEDNVQKAIWLSILILTPLSWAINFGLPTNETLIFV
ncbi:hypothetical protein MPER_04990, partial [Moniliophthora perniciosa FA553]